MTHTPKRRTFPLTHAAQLYRLGLTATAIGKATRFSANTVKTKLRQAGIPIRGKPGRPPGSTFPLGCATILLHTMSTQEIADHLGYHQRTISKRLS